jgi:predicted outer membrane repeat protein
MNYGSGPIVSNCAFVGNTTSYGGGGGILNEGADCLAKVHRCVFATNVASGGTTACGGGIRNRAGTPEIRDCVFSNNAAYQGGAVHNQSSTPLISNCQFIANSAGACGAMANGGNGRPLVMDCLFASNRAPSAGALGSVGAGAGGRIVNCRFVANAATTAGEYGGAIFSYYDRSVISNCCFLGNRSGLGGGIGIYDTASNYIVNCTFASNTATSTGGGLYTRSTSAQAMDNCILWANASPSGPNFYRRTPSGSVTFRFADVQGCGGSGAGWNAAFGTDGGGNIDADPLFADLPKWDAHEKSLIGRWTPGGIWVQDAQHSPCIDAGNDAFPVGKEPSPNGGRINMGAYGGTAQASKSRVLSGSMVAIL